MAERTVTLLLALIKYSLFGSPLSEDHRGSLTEEALDKLYVLSNKHDLAHLAGDALYKAHLLPKDSPTAAKFQKAQMVALYRYTRLEQERGMIYRTLGQAKIPFVPLKGTVIRPMYPQPHLRTSCDIDILVHKEDISRATEALASDLGYTTNGIQSSHDISLFSPSGNHLELHFSIERMEGKMDRLLSRVWEFCAPVSEDSYEYHQSPEYFMFHQISHMATHFLCGGCGVRPFVDLYLLKQKLVTMMQP